MISIVDHPLLKLQFDLINTARANTYSDNFKDLPPDITVCLIEEFQRCSTLGTPSLGDQCILAQYFTELSGRKVIVDHDKMWFAEEPFIVTKLCFILAGFVLCFDRECFPQLIKT